MKKRIVWLVVSGLMVVSLVLASCAPKVTEEKKVVPEEKKVVTEEKKVVTQKEVVTEKVEVPRYGGVLNLAIDADPLLGSGFSNSYMFKTRVPKGEVRPTNEPLLMRDLLKGPDGSGEWDGLQMSMVPTVDELVGQVAESFEIIQPDTLKFKIRKGIHWHDKAPTYGAELTPEDAVYSFVLPWTRTGSGWRTGNLFLSDMKNPGKSIYIDPDDPRTVVFKAAPGQLGELWELVANKTGIVPKALGPIEGEGFVDWKGVVGTGAFLLTDYVSGSSMTWQRNPNYWRKDPFYPQNQLPYIDGQKLFVISDLSTRQAALRTGKIDVLPNVLAEEWEGLMRTSPQLLWIDTAGDANALSMRHDVKPFDDVRVRRAMQMAINLDEMVKDYYKGKAEKFWWPGLPIKEHRLWYRGLWEEMPESVKELYTYNPEKAKKLLDEAGLPGPNRFTTSILLPSSEEDKIDLAAIVAAYWARVGVTLKIDIRETAVAKAMQSAFTYEHGLIDRISPGEFRKYNFSQKDSNSNKAFINDPLVEATYQAVVAAYFDLAEVSRIHREATAELHNRALHIYLPVPKIYIMWQPWLKRYHGVVQPNYSPNTTSILLVGQYPLWIDQELKQKMTGRR